MLKEKSPRFIGERNSFIRGTLLVLVFMLVSGVFSYAETDYLDVGNVPEKLYVKEIIKMEVPLGYEYRAISPKGSYIAMIHEDDKGVVTTLICDKNGKKVREFRGMELLEWINNEDKFLGEKSNGDIVIKDIKRGVEKKLKLNSDKIIYIKYNIFRDSIFVQYEGEAEAENLYEYDLKSDKIRLIYKSRNNRMYPIPVSRNEIVYYKSEFIESTRVIVYRVNIRSDKRVKIYDYYSGYSYIKPYILRNKEVRFILDKDGCLSVGDKNGKIHFKVDIRLWDDKENIASDQLSFEQSALSPNGKIIASTSYAFENPSEFDVEKPIEDYKYSIADIIVANSSDDNKAWTLSLNAERVDPPYELVKAWSPSGDRLIYIDAKDKRYYITKIGVKR